jgi:N6-L-threonylcarbamoyladenine synthase
LGIESTAHTFGVGIVKRHGKRVKVLANEKSVFVTKKGGIHPRLAAEHHFEKAPEIIRRALQKARVGIDDVDVFAFAKGPGMGPALRVGAVAARTLSLAHKRPLLGVNHCVAHIEIAKLFTRAKDPVVVYVSGGNTQIIALIEGRYRVFGETLDIGVGNLLDSFGRAMGLGFPAGPKLDKWYFKGKHYISLPYSVKGSDLVFAGLETAAKQKIGKVNKYDLAYSMLHTAFAMITEVTERALAHTGKQHVVLTGGVAASRALQKMLNEMCAQRKAKLFIPPQEYCTDNGAMIALLGLLEHEAGVNMSLEETAVKQRYRTDEVEVCWHQT